MSKGTTINAETAEHAERILLCELCEFCVAVICSTNVTSGLSRTLRSSVRL
jgi:hypothetical protein